MKRANLHYLVFFFILTIAFSSCKNNWALMEQNADKVEIQVKPNPLEMRPTSDQKQKVRITVSGKFPTEYFDKNARVIVTPVLKTHTGDEIKLKPQTFIGEKVRDNVDVIPYEAGKSFRIDNTLDYNDAMRYSEVYLRAKAINEKKGTEFEFPERKIADGVITTVLLAQRGLEVDNTEEKYESENEFAKLSFVEVTLPEQSETKIKSDIHYTIQQSNIRTEEKKADDISKMFEDVKASNTGEFEFKGFEISSYASPDGSEDLNTNLSNKRGKSAVNYLKSEIKKLNKKSDNKLDASLIDSKTTAEDWEGFQKLMNDPSVSIPDKQVILRVLNMYSDPEVREREIKKIAEAYESMKTEVLPKLRRSEIKATFIGKKKTDAEILKLASEAPEDLKVVELLHAAALTNDLAKKETIYKKIIEMKSDCWAAYNNLGVVNVYQNKQEDAKKNFEKSVSLNKNQYSYNNIGVVELSGNNFDAAEENFNNVLEMESSEVTEVSNYNMGFIALTKGDYVGAVKYFGAKKSFNASLAQLLNGDANRALSTLNGMGEKDHPFYYYLKAILGARTKNEAILFSNLEKAISKEPALKSFAKTDVEFLSYFEKTKFKSLTK